MFGAFGEAVKCVRAEEHAYRQLRLVDQVGAVERTLHLVHVRMVAPALDQVRLDARLEQLVHLVVGALDHFAVAGQLHGERWGGGSLVMIEARVPKANEKYF